MAGRPVGAGRRVMGREEGAAAVEFALIAPIVLALAFGILTGGLAYNRWLSVTHASREAARFGSTIPLPVSGVSNAWLDDVRDRAVESAYGELDPGVPDLFICVAYVGENPNLPGGNGTLWTRNRVESSSGVSYNSANCGIADGRGLTEPRVQVVAGRTSEFIGVIFPTTQVPIRSEAVSRFERVAF